MGIFDKIIAGIFIIGALSMIIALTIESYNIITEECVLEGKYKLKSVNGITDSDTGLFSQGSISRTTLLFENGLIFDIKKSEAQGLILGNYYEVYDCEYNGLEIRR